MELACETAPLAGRSRHFGFARARMVDDARHAALTGALYQLFVARGIRLRFTRYHGRAAVVAVDRNRACIAGRHQALGAHLSQRWPPAALSFYLRGDVCRVGPGGHFENAIEKRSFRYLISVDLRESEPGGS